MRCRLLALFWLTLVLYSGHSLTLGRGLQAERVAAEQPPDLVLRVHTDNGRTEYQIGEIIRLKLSFTSSSAKKYQINMASYDRSGRMNYEEFRIAPDGSWSDPWRAYFANGLFFMGGLTTFRVVSREAAVISLDLNEWVRFDRPGEYRVRIVSHRVVELPKDKTQSQTTTELISNELLFTIKPAARPWQNETLKTASAEMELFRAADGKTDSTARENERRAAAKILRYLGTVDATKELARRLRGDDSNVDFECMLGLVGSPHSDVALGEMQRLLADPDHPVSSTFLRALIVLMRSPYRSAEAVREEDAKNRQVVSRELLEAVTRKRGKALALSLNAVLESGNYLEDKTQPLSRQMADQIATVFDQLPIEKQVEILESRWDLIKSPSFLPGLRRYALQYKDYPIPNEMNAHNSLHLTGAALQRWYELEPEEARTVIIREVNRAKPRYSARILGILPDKTLPEVEQELAEHFAAQQDSYGAENLASLIQRYATDSVLPRVLPVVDEHVGKWACTIQAPILAYLLRASRDTARPRIEAAIAARGDGYSACNHSLLMDLAAMQEDPILEEIAVHGLEDNDPEVAANAATYMGRYGSPAAEEKLWAHLIRWNEKWRGREEELRDVPGESGANLRQRSLGMNLLAALAKAKSWLTDERKLQRLRNLALGPDAGAEVDRWLAEWGTKPWTISYYESQKRQHFQILQYETDSLKSLEEKLMQFPPGSSFDWAGPAADDKSPVREISDFLVNHGMKLSGPAH